MVSTRYLEKESDTMKRAAASTYSYLILENVRGIRSAGPTGIRGKPCVGPPG